MSCYRIFIQELFMVIQLLRDLVQVGSYALQLTVGLLIEDRYPRLEDPVFKDELSDHFCRRLVGIGHEFDHVFFFPWGHPEGEPPGAFVVDIYGWSCHGALNAVKCSS